MIETVTVKAVGEGNPWKHDITYYDILFDRNGEDFEASWGKKGAAPEVGEEVEGEFSQRNGEWKFKKGSADFNNPPVRSDGGSSEYVAKPANGNREKSIFRQVALKIFGPRIIKEGLTDEIVGKVAQLEEFIEEAGQPTVTKEQMAEVKKNIEDTFPGTEEIDKEEQIF